MLLRMTVLALLAVAGLASAGMASAQTPRTLNGAGLDSPPTAALSPGIEANGLLFISGQLAYSAAARGIPADMDVTAQTEVVMQRIDAILRAEGLTMANIIKVTIFLTDFNDFLTMNAVYSRWVREPFPARSTIGVAFLPFRAKVEIEVIARR
ncbi:RidA family protein [Sediminicoccus sp. KRV36]|uniref:RidA family protein n=1 Tax=Sediminicoccus sp. KRV36 TaxID=3133721 RepID=UPI00200DF843|nr:RidA family protein [Sediminicoccus rosea]UPY38629.1 RidA family protein [Sediminicoccus rosea]